MPMSQASICVVAVGLVYPEPDAAPFAFKGAGFDFAFFQSALLPPAPLNPPHCRSTLNSHLSLLIT